VKERERKKSGKGEWERLSEENPSEGWEKFIRGSRMANEPGEATRR